MFYLFYFNSWSDWHVCISEYLCTLLFCGSLKYIKQDHFLSSKVSKCEMCITFLLLSMIDGAAVKMKARSKTQPLKILTIWYSHLFSPCYPVRILLILSHFHIVWWDLPYKHVDILILEWNVSECIYDVCVRICILPLWLLSFSLFFILVCVASMQYVPSKYSYHPRKKLFFFALVTCYPWYLTFTF